MKRRAPRPLRAALAAVLAWGLMMPAGALAAEGPDSEVTDPAPLLEQPAGAGGRALPAVSTSRDWSQAAAAGDLQVLGGTAGTHWRMEGNALHIMDDEPLVLRNNPGKATAATTIVIDKGVKAELTLDGVNIRISSGCPIDLLTNLTGTADGMTATTGEAIIRKTSLYLKIADGKDNVLYTSDGNGAGIHCGEGSELVIDDERDNRAADGTMARVVGAKVAKDITLKDGTSLAAGAPSSELDSPNAGKLTVTGGLRAAGIGSTALENGGTMTFNGGNLKVDVQGAYNGESDGTSLSAGIGAGAQGDGTASLITFNGGTIWSHGGVHGSGIGAAHSGCLGGTPRNDIIRTRHTANATNVAGDIAINGGFITSVGGEHGGAFGSACWSYNQGHTITVTGGTLIPIAGKGSTGSHTHGKPFPEIGGWGGHVVITGGSVRCTDPTQYFQGVGDTAWGSTDFSKEENKVTMVSIDLSEELKRNNIAEGIDPGELNSLIESWELSVGGEPYTYGAPVNFDNGKLYLWLPKSATEKQISVTLQYKDKNGASHEVLPLFREPGQTGDLLKRFLDFQITDASYIASLTKYYDGTPLPAYDLSAPGAAITTPPPDNKTLDRVKDSAGNSLIRYYYQPFDRTPDDEGEGDPQPTGEETSETVDDGSGHITTVLPSNAGAVRLTMVSKQYADETSADAEIQEFAKSYWGHRAFMWGKIIPVASVVRDLAAEWSDEAEGSTERPGAAPHPSDRELVVSAIIERAETVDGKPDSEPTEPTCASPEGRVQLYVDGEAVGSPIELRFEDKKDADGNVILNSAGQPAFPANAVRGGDDTAGHWTAFTYAFKPSETDYLVPGIGVEGRHEVSLKFLPPSAEQVTSGTPANYTESVDPAEEPDNAPKAEVAIDPIDPNPTTGLEKPDGFDPTLPEPGIQTDPDPTPDDPNADPSKPGNKTYHGTVTLYYKGHGEDEPNPGRIELKLDTPSSGPVTVTTADGTIVKAELKRDEEGNPVRDDDGKLIVLLDPEAVGRTELTIKQEPNGAYTGTTFEYDVTVKPDPQIAPVTSITKTAANLTHPNGPTQSGDVIRYTITASNSAAGSAWNNVIITDELPACLDLAPDSLTMKNPSEGFDGALAPASGALGSQPGRYQLDTRADGGTTLAVASGTVGGGASAQITFECTVRQGLTGRDKTDVPLANIASAAGTRPDPDDPYHNPELPENPDPSDPALPSGGSVVAPDDPAAGDLVSGKTVENLTEPDAHRTKLGDRLRYTLTLENQGAVSSCLRNVIASDPLPVGIEPVPETIELSIPGATSPIKVPGSAYDADSRTLSVHCGDLWGGERAVLTFEATVTEAALGTNATNVAFFGGTPPSRIPNPDKAPEPAEPGSPAEPPEGSGDTLIAETPGATPPVIIPNDPSDGDVRVAKTAENATSADGKTRVGDTVRYRIVLANDGPGTGWMDAVIRDDVPRGLEPVSESIQMTLADGTVVPVSDEAYDEKTRRLSVSAGRLYGGQEIALAFDALVTEEAVGADIGNVAQALGTLPSQWDPDADGGFPAAGEPFDPPAGWEAFDRASERVESAAAYPPGTNEKGGVIPAENGATPDEGTTIRLKRLAQTGDDLAAGFALGAGAALAAALALLLARRRLRRAR